MTRSRLLTVCLAGFCLVLAALLKPVPEKADASVEAAVGRSLGGLRVLLVDVMFLRAEALQKDGRVEEARALYDTILELDPANDAAAAYLVDVYMNELLPLATTESGRSAWWTEGWLLANRALELNPDSPHLHTRVGSLLWSVPLQQPDILGRIERLVPDRESTALEHFFRAARLTPKLPRLGFLHVWSCAALATQVAAAAGADGREAIYRRAMEVGTELLELRSGVLARIEPPVIREGGVSEGIPYDRVLAAGLAAVAAMHRAEAAGDRSGMAVVADKYEQICGENVLLDRLRAWARR